MRTIALIFGAILAVSGLNAQTAATSAPSDAVSGYTYDFDLAKKLIIDYQLSPNKDNAIAKTIVEAKDFPKLSGKPALNNVYHESLNMWMEKNPALIIETLKTRKDIVHYFEK